MTLLTGRAIALAAAVWDLDSRLRNSVTYFIQQISEVFEYPHGGKDVLTKFINLTQGNCSAAEFAIEFRTLAAQSGWNDVALKAMFQKSLNCDLQAELACKGEESSFSDFITLTIRIDNLMRQVPKRKSGSLDKPTISHTTLSKGLLLQNPCKSTRPNYLRVRENDDDINDINVFLLW